MDEEVGPSPKRFRFAKPAIKTIHVTEIERNGSSRFVSMNGVRVSSNSIRLSLNGEGD